MEEVVEILMTEVDGNLGEYGRQDLGVFQLRESLKKLQMLPSDTFELF